MFLFRCCVIEVCFTITNINEHFSFQKQNDPEIHMKLIFNDRSRAISNYFISNTIFSQLRIYLSNKHLSITAPFFCLLYFNSVNQILSMNIILTNNNICEYHSEMCFMSKQFTNIKTNKNHAPRENSNLECDKKFSFPIDMSL